MSGSGDGGDDPASTALGVAVVGTYDGGLVGWEVSPTRLKMIFAYTPHQGSVRALAIPNSGAKAGLVMASGGADDHIRLYDLKRRAEAGELLQHQGTITCLRFVGSTHMLSGSEDGTICIWRVHDWSLMQVLGGHKGPVVSFSVHPSGKLALSVGKDRTLRLWDLIKGRCAYINKLEAASESVVWSPKGDYYALTIGPTNMELRQATTNQPSALLTHPQRITALSFLDESVVLTACEDRVMRCVSGDSGGLDWSQDVSDHCGRVKDMSRLGDGRVVTVSTDGKCMVWEVGAKEGRMVPLGTASLGAGVRITCLAVSLGQGEEVQGEGGEGEGKKKKKKKRKREEVEGDGEPEEEEEVIAQPQRKKDKKKGHQQQQQQQQQSRADKISSSKNETKKQPAPSPSSEQKAKKQQQQQGGQSGTSKVGTSSGSSGGKKPSGQFSSRPPKALVNKRSIQKRIEAKKAQGKKG